MAYFHVIKKFLSDCRQLIEVRNMSVSHLSIQSPSPEGMYRQNSQKKSDLLAAAIGLLPSLLSF